MKTMIFLEVHNVLNTANYRETLSRLNNGRAASSHKRNLNRTKMKMLKEILDETGAELIICSTDRNCSKHMINFTEQLSLCGIELYGPMSMRELELSKNESAQRLCPILTRQGYEQFVFIDSPMNEDCMSLSKTFLVKDLDNGLTEELSNEIISYIKS